MCHAENEIKGCVIAIGKGTSWEGEEVGEVSENDAGDDCGYGKGESMGSEWGLEREDAERRVK